MSEVLASLKKKGGGKMSETVLWTNPSPTSSFASQAVILDGNATDYDYIKIVFLASTGLNVSFNAIFPLAELVASLQGTTGNRPASQIGSGLNGAGLYARRVYYYSPTNLRFTGCALIGASTSDNTQVVPTQIIGMKY